MLGLPSTEKVFLFLWYMLLFLSYREEFSRRICDNDDRTISGVSYWQSSRVKLIFRLAFMVQNEIEGSTTSWGYCVWTSCRVLFCVICTVFPPGYGGVMVKTASEFEAVFILYVMQWRSSFYMWRRDSVSRGSPGLLWCDLTLFGLFHAFCTDYDTIRHSFTAWRTCNSENNYYLVCRITVSRELRSIWGYSGSRLRTRGDESLRDFCTGLPCICCKTSNHLVESSPFQFVFHQKRQCLGIHTWQKDNRW